MMTSIPSGIWKEDWDRARQAWTTWWEHKGLALSVRGLKEEPWAEVPMPRSPLEVSPDTMWLDPIYRAQLKKAWMARTYHGGTAFPLFDTTLGPGTLGMLLGCKAHPDKVTVWYEPVIHDPENHPPLKLHRGGEWWRCHMAIMEEALRQAQGHYLVGLPDIIENIDTLAQLRDSQTVLMDLMERPEWVKEKLQEINRAYFECFDAMRAMVTDPWGGNGSFAYHIWGPGKTAKVQCDLCCMISPAMFKEFVLPPLREQCQWLDYSMYHLDGTQAIMHLDTLLGIEALDAIQWQPQSGLPDGGDPCWYDLYRRIKAGGKSVMAVGVNLEEVLPLIDAVGPEGLNIATSWRPGAGIAPSEKEVRELLRKVGW